MSTVPTVARSVRRRHCRRTQLIDFSPMKLAAPNDGMMQPLKLKPWEYGRQLSVMRVQISECAPAHQVPIVLTICMHD